MTRAMGDEEATAVGRFLAWLKRRHVKIDESLEIKRFQHEGLGLIATKDLPASYEIFSIPRPKTDSSKVVPSNTRDPGYEASLGTAVDDEERRIKKMRLSSPKSGTQEALRHNDIDLRLKTHTTHEVILNLKTSNFLRLIDREEFLKLDKNWNLLLTCLMYEFHRFQQNHKLRCEGRIESTLPCGETLDDDWGDYFQLTPTKFDTLMFWSSEELEELKGSTVLEKIGKEQAEADYLSIVKPFIKSRADLFSSINLPDSIEKNNEDEGLRLYHRMGSLVLSRSFHLEDDEELCQSVNSSDECQDQEEQDEERERIEDISLLPLADLLNAKSGCENVKLFYEPEWLRMITTKPISRGEQIYNTYSNPPNADLLRRYGHVDESNPFDLVEVHLQTCQEVAQTFLNQPDLKIRSQVAVNMGIDDVFSLPTESERKREELGILPIELVKLLQIYLLSDEAFFQLRKHQESDESSDSTLQMKLLGKPKLSSAKIITLASQIIHHRLKEYPTSLEFDQNLLSQWAQITNPCVSSSSRRKWSAVIVRHSEKLILTQTISNLEKKLLMVCDKSPH